MSADRVASLRDSCGGVCVLQAVLNGSRPADAHPALPVLARHLARDARDVAQLGISSVHVHPRGPDQQETLDPIYVGDTVAAIRAQVPGMEIGVTTGRWIQPDPVKRIEAVLAWGHLGVGKPDVCSVNVHEKGWVDVCAAAASVGIGVELGRLDQRRRRHLAHHRGAPRHHPRAGRVHRLRP